MILKSDITLLLNYMHFNIDWLLYFSIGCFGLAFSGACMNFIDWLKKPSEHKSKWYLQCIEDLVAKGIIKKVY